MLLYSAATSNRLLVTLVRTPSPPGLLQRLSPWQQGQQQLLLQTSAESTASCNGGGKKSSEKTLFEKSLSVPSLGGTLSVNTPFNVKVRPLGPFDHPNMDRAFIKVTAATKSGAGSIESETLVKLGGQTLNVETTSTSPSDGGDATKTISIPMVHNVSVDASSNASIEVEDFIESDFCTLTSDRGDITAARIKTAKLTLTSNSGDIVCSGHLQGNVVIKTKSGNVIGDKRFTGPSIDVTTESGDIRVASSYAEQAKFSTNTGSMNLRNLHNESYIVVYDQGDVKAIGIDGAANIFVKKGDVDVHITRLSAESRIHVEKGDVRLRISDTFPLKVNIDANDIIPDTKFAAHGSLEVRDEGEICMGQLNSGPGKHYHCAIEPDKFSPSLIVMAEDGNVILESQDWAASLGLKMPMPK